MDTQDAALFATIAEIAGVFVGFGALIGVTRRNEIAASQLVQIRAVVTVGLVVVVAALVPVAIGRFDIAPPDLWFGAALVFLVLEWGVIAFSLRARENRDLLVTQSRTRPVVSAAFWLLLEVPAQLLLVLILVGIARGSEPALYLSALVLNLFQAAFVLAQLVYSQAGGDGDPG